MGRLPWTMGRPSILWLFEMVKLPFCSCALLPFWIRFAALHMQAITVPSAEVHTASLLVIMRQIHFQPLGQLMMRTACSSVQPSDWFSLEPVTSFQIKCLCANPVLSALSHVLWKLSGWLLPAMQVKQIALARGRHVSFSHPVFGPMVIKPKSQEMNPRHRKPLLQSFLYNLVISMLHAAILLLWDCGNQV